MDLRAIPRVTTVILFAGALLLGSAVGSANGDPGKDGPKNGTVLIIRHGEKPPDSDKSSLLSPVGDKRAQKYIDYFEHLKINGVSATPVFVFATKKSKASDRPWLTVKPFVAKYGVPHNHAIKNADYTDLVKLLKGGGYDGKTVLVCWHHGNIPVLIDGLGANHKKLLGGDKWPNEEFGWLVELHFGAHGKLKDSVVVNEHLMKDDTLNPPGAK